jgi:hypothetical protein
MTHIRRNVRYNWTPDLDLNSLGPVTNPDRPSEKVKRRNRLLMDMLIDIGALSTARKIMAAYPHLSDEYADIVMLRQAELATEES